MFLQLLILIGSAIWVGYDASKIGVRRGLVTGLGNMNVPMWIIAVLGLWIIAFPCYLIYRPKYKEALKKLGEESQN